MTYRNIYNTALSLLGEVPGASGLEDYEARAKPLLAMISAELSECSRALGGGEAQVAVEVSLESSFPLAERLAFVAATRLAARLVFDETPELTKSLDSAAADLLERTMRSATSLESVREVYNG